MAVVTGQIQPAWSFSEAPATGFFSGQTFAIPLTLSTAFKTSGVLLDQCNLISANQLALAASPQTLDLRALLDPFGAAVVFARVRAIAIQHLGQTDGQPLLVGNSVTNEWNAFLTATAKLTVFPGTATNPNGGWFILTAPNTTGMVVDSTHKTLKFDPGANTFGVNAVFVGCDA